MSNASGMNNSNTNDMNTDDTFCIRCGTCWSEGDDQPCPEYSTLPCEWTTLPGQDDEQRAADLSRAATALLRAQRHDAEVADDLAAFYAPAECYGDVDWETERLDEVVQPFGFADVDAFKRVATERGVPGRFLHFVLGV